MDWLYSEERLELRAKCLSRLFHKYGWELNEQGMPMYSMEAIHSCGRMTGYHRDTSPKSVS